MLGRSLLVTTGPHEGPPRTQGYTELLELLREHRERHSFNLPVDVFGSGEDLAAIKARAQAYELEVHFQGARDHLDESIHPYRSAPLVAPHRLAWCSGGSIL